MRRGASSIVRAFVLSLLAAAFLVGASACSREPAGQEAGEAAYEGTIGDAMADFVEAIEAMADILSDVQSLEDCAGAKAPLEAQVERLRGLHGVVGSLSLQSWARMPRSLDDRRRAALTRFNAEAVRVMIKRERGLVLREVFSDVPSLIYAEQQG